MDMFFGLPAFVVIAFVIITQPIVYIPAILIGMWYIGREIRLAFGRRPPPLPRAEPERTPRYRHCDK